MIAPEVEQLLVACPFLATHLDADDFNLPTVIFGATAQLLIERTLPQHEENAVFAHFNDLAERGDVEETLGTGAIELFNDTPAAQQLAREKLTGRARTMLDQFREFWGQPDYGRSA